MPELGLVEKFKPTYDLADIKRLVGEDACKVSMGAIATAHALGITETQLKEGIQLLENKDFYKSVTQFNNHQVWQDVYKKRIYDHNIYIKLKIATVNGQLLIITSFKKDTSA